MTKADAEMEALKMLKGWSTWVAAINTGAIFAIVSMFKDDKIAGDLCLKISIFSFFLSVFFAAILLGEIPAIAKSIPDKHTKPIHSHTIWIFNYKTCIPLWALSGLEHITFLLGLFMLSWSLMKKIT